MKVNTMFFTDRVPGGAKTYPGGGVYFPLGSIALKIGELRYLYSLSKNALKPNEYVDYKHSDEDDDRYVVGKFKDLRKMKLAEIKKWNIKLHSELYQQIIAAIFDFN